MNKFLEGGNWDCVVSAGFFRLDCSYFHVMGREINLYHEVDREGLPDRWVKIMMGQTNWIPKIVFELVAEKKRR